jgi:tRNA/rRNA methyltransferase
MRIRIILVEPHEAGNVGAAARAMKNFGVSDLWIVGSRPQRMDDISYWWAKGAEDVVANARTVATLEEALAGVHLSAATTAIRGRHVFEPLTPFELARVAEETLGSEHTLGIVFGREESGLTGREVAMCQRTATVPTSHDAPTMNLAQCVAIFCYEFAKGLRPAARHADPPAGALVQALSERARALLIDVGFFGNRSPDRNCAELQALAGRARLTTRETSMLLSFIAHVEKSLRCDE